MALAPTVSRLAAVRHDLDTRGFSVLTSFAAGSDSALALARALGTIHVPNGTDPAAPWIETRPAENASYLAPFDSAEAIGWHNDFSTHERRAVVSLAYLARPDPRGGSHGAWRAASSSEVIAELRCSPEGAGVVDFLLETPLPFSFTPDDDPVLFHVLERRGPGGDRLGIRFYGRAIRDGARRSYGEVPQAIERAISAIELAADRVGETFAAPAGSLLVTHNWYALRDRLAQTVTPGLPLRRSLVCFLEAIDET